MTPDALTRPARTKAQAAADMRERAKKLRARAALQPDYVAVVLRAEANRLDRMAAELEDER